MCKLKEEAVVRLFKAAKGAQNSKGLNQIHLTSVMYTVLSSSKMSINDVSISFGSLEFLALELARRSFGFESSPNSNSFLDATCSSLLCREHDEKRITSYGTELNYRFAFDRSSSKEITVEGKLQRIGDIVMLQVGYMYLHIDNSEIMSAIKTLTGSDCFSVDDFLWSNRPYGTSHGTNSSRTKGVLEYNLLLDNERLYINGLFLPKIREADTIPVSPTEKNLVKKELDLLKRRKNMYVLLSNASSGTKFLLEKNPAPILKYFQKVMFFLLLLRMLALVRRLDKPIEGNPIMPQR
jgi:hypothetical protein